MLLFVFHLPLLCKPGRQGNILNIKSLNLWSGEKSEDNRWNLSFHKLWIFQDKKNNGTLSLIIYLVNPPVLDTINYLWSVMTPSWCAKDGATSLMYIIDDLGCQRNGIARIETSISSLQMLQLWSVDGTRLKKISKSETTPLAVYNRKQV